MLRVRVCLFVRKRICCNWKLSKSKTCLCNLRLNAYSLWFNSVALQQYYKRLWKMLFSSNPVPKKRVHIPFINCDLCTFVCIQQFLFFFCIATHRVTLMSFSLPSSSLSTQADSTCHEVYQNSVAILTTNEMYKNKQLYNTNMITTTWTWTKTPPPAAVAAAAITHTFK